MSKLIEQLKKHEGFRDKPYRCTAGKLTIGYGWNLEDNSFPENIAEQLMFIKVSEAEEQVIAEFPSLDVVRRAVLINMAFNIGWSRLMGFKRMRAAVEAQDFTRAAGEMMDSKWARQVGYRAVELSIQMSTGEWYNEED